MRQMSPHALALYFGLGTVLLVCLCVALLRYISKRDLEADPGPPAAPGGDAIVVGGKTYGLHAVASAAGFSHWVLSLPSDAARTFSVQREDGLEWLIDHLGVMGKISTGDARFDAEFEIRSPDASWAATFFADPENRRLVQVLFGLDSSTVLLSKGRLQACFEERAALAEGAAALSDLAARLPGAA